MKFTRFSKFLGAFTLIALLVSIFSNTLIANAAFGTSPPWVRNDHMLPGTSFEQVITMSRSGLDTAMQAKVVLYGDKDLLKWVTIENADNLILEKGEKSLPMKVTVDVPKRAALKKYSGSIDVTLESVVKDTSMKGGQVAIALGSNVSIDIVVIGDKISDYNVRSINVDPIEEGNPFSFKIRAQNLGNVDVSDIEGQIEIYNKAETEMVASSDFTQLLDPIAPDDTVISRMVFEDIELDPGIYWVIAKALKDGEITYETRLHLEITEAVVPVVTPEDAIGKKPALPGAAEEVTDIQDTEADDLKSAAPAATAIPVAAAETSSVFLIFGLAGLGLGLVALIGIIIVLVMVLKRQQQPAPVQPVQPQPIQPQAVQPQPAPPVQPQPVQPVQPQIIQPVQPAPPEQPQAVQPPPENGTVDNGLGEKK